MLTSDEMVTDRCCTCRKPVDEENSLVIVRADGKRPEARRCRCCHNVRSAINRLASKHGNLVKDFTKVEGPKLQAFYEAHGSLRGENLRVKVEEVVQDWKNSTTRVEFNQVGNYMDEEDLKKKYADKPEDLKNILLNARTFWCPVKKKTLYSDPEYSAKVQDAVEHGTSEKIKGQAGLDDTSAAEPEPKRPKKTKKETGNGSAEQKEKKWTAGVKNKVTKKIDNCETKNLQLKDLVDKCNGYAGMIPGYVITHATDTIGSMEKLLQNAQAALQEATGDAKGLQDALDESSEKIKEAAARVKSQLTQAAAFTT